ncbi:hypothetical protein BX265_6851, partial [Streptomyces sp. TLI_235]
VRVQIQTFHRPAGVQGDRQIQLCVPLVSLKGESYRMRGRELGRVPPPTTTEHEHDDARVRTQPPKLGHGSAAADSHRPSTPGQPTARPGSRPGTRRCRPRRGPWPLGQACGSWPGTGKAPKNSRGGPPPGTLASRPNWRRSGASRRRARDTRPAGRRCRITSPQNFAALPVKRPRRRLPPADLAEQCDAECVVVGAGGQHGHGDDQAEDIDRQPALTARYLPGRGSGHVHRGVNALGVDHDQARSLRLPGLLAGLPAEQVVDLHVVPPSEPVRRRPVTRRNHQEQTSHAEHEVVPAPVPSPSPVGPPIG